MRESPPTKLAAIGVAALAAGALVGAAVAAGAGSTHKGSTTTTTPSRPARTPQTPLTGDVLASVEAGVIAKVGGTVDAATTENDGSIAGAAYEVHVTKADGSRATVILDSGFAVLGVETHPEGGPGHFQR